MGNKKLYGLIGNPLTHSFSKIYFTEKFEKEHIVNCEFKLFPLETIQLLPQLLKENDNLAGLSVTLPYKESVIPFLNELDETAKVTGAVNCIKIERTNSGVKQLSGFNTDVYGFQQSIKPFLESQHQRALILGTGGAAKAIAYILNTIGIDCFFAVRDKSKAAKSFSGQLFSYEELNDHIIFSCKLIINATPVGMFPDSEKEPLIPYHAISSEHLLYDLVYNPAETEFLKRGKNQSASVVNGLSMLHLQAEEAWKIWNKN